MFYFVFQTRVITYIRYFNLFSQFSQEAYRKKEQRLHCTTQFLQDSIICLQRAVVLNTSQSYSLLFCLQFIRFISVLCIINSPTLPNEFQISHSAMCLFQSKSESRNTTRLFKEIYSRVSISTCFHGCSTALPSVVSLWASLTALTPRLEMTCTRIWGCYMVHGCCWGIPLHI